jgi:hypothetical protein
MDGRPQSICAEEDKEVEPNKEKQEEIIFCVDY